MKTNDAAELLGSLLDLEQMLEERAADQDRSARLGASIYSAQARQRIEYLQELKRLRRLVGDDALEDF